MHSLKSIVVGIDFSSACDQVLKKAERIAKWNGAELPATHVLDDGGVDTLNAQETDLRSKNFIPVTPKVLKRPVPSFWRSFAGNWLLRLSIQLTRATAA